MFVAAIERTERRRILLSGPSTAPSVVFAAVQALHDNYEVFVVENGCGDLSYAAHANALQPMTQAGAKPVNGLSVLLELQRDWAMDAGYSAVIKILRTHAGRYGSGFGAPGSPPSPTVGD